MSFVYPASRAKPSLHPLNVKNCIIDRYKDKMTRKHFLSKRLTVVTVLALAVLAILAEALPGYLAYSDKPSKADVAVLFIGRDYRSRIKKARTLISEGYTDRLIISVYDLFIGTIEMTGKNGSSWERMPASIVDPDKLEHDINVMRARNPQYHPYLENTHVETLESKRMMDRYGFRSALFVSSPGHMRRIRMIAGDVFDSERYRIAFVPTRFEQPPEGLHRYPPARMAGAALECVKILWFQTYRLGAGKTESK
ncbi:MAG TPA: hypothetical protein PLO63_06385 [Syntrophales bacterium]|nr:hypothetical protein [Syntrophales bacterium]